MAPPVAVVFATGLSLAFLAGISSFWSP